MREVACSIECPGCKAHVLTQLTTPMLMATTIAMPTIETFLRVHCVGWGSIIAPYSIRRHSALYPCLCETQLGWIREDALPILLLVVTSITFPAAAFTSIAYYLPFIDSTSAAIFLLAGFAAAIVPSAAVWLGMTSRAGPRWVSV